MITFKIEPGGAVVHYQLDSKIPADHVMVFYGRDIVPVEGQVTTPPPAFHFRVKVLPMNLIVRERPTDRSTEVGKVGYDTVLDIVELASMTYWGRIETPKAGWVDLTYCEIVP